MCMRNMNNETRKDICSCMKTGKGTKFNIELRRYVEIEKGAKGENKSL